MELIRSSGEENAGGIAALGKALVLLQRIGFDRIREEEQALTARVLRGMARRAVGNIFRVIRLHLFVAARCSHALDARAGAGSVRHHPVPVSTHRKALPIRPRLA